MRQLILVLGCILSLFFVGSNSVQAWTWGDRNLVTINDENFTADDFKNWWANWQEDDIPFPDTPDFFIQWHLLAREAEQMQLYNEPSYRHKIEVFLKARTLLIFQSDKINSRIEISESDLQKRYTDLYLPRFYLNILYFNEENKAKEAYDLLKAGNCRLEEFARQESEKEEGKVFYQEKMVRLQKLDKEWRAVLENLSPGEMSSPFAWSKGYVLLCLKGQDNGDAKDLAGFKHEMSKDLRKIKQARMTEELVGQLKERYQVEVDRPLFESINLAEDNEKLLDKPLITIDKENYPVRVFLEHVNKEKDFRTQYGYDVQKAEEFKKSILNGILAQTLVSKAAIDEHYEDREPFKPVFQFYQQHRLIIELEKRLFRTGEKPGEEEINSYYKAHLDDYSQPERVVLSVLKDDRNLIEKMSEEMKRGVDFHDVVARYYASGVSEETMLYKQLDPVVLSVLEQMAVGDVSSPFEVRGHHAIVKLVKRIPAVAMPFDHVRDDIVKRVEEEKYQRLRNEYLDALTARSEISINKREWRKIKKEFGDLHGAEKN